MLHAFGRLPTAQLWPGPADMLTNGYLVPDLCLSLIYSNVYSDTCMSKLTIRGFVVSALPALVQTLVVCCPVRTPAQLQHSCFVCCYYSRLTVPRCRAADMCCTLCLVIGVWFWCLVFGVWCLVVFGVCKDNKTNEINPKNLVIDCVIQTMIRCMGIKVSSVACRPLPPTLLFMTVFSLVKVSSACVQCQSAMF